MAEFRRFFCGFLNRGAINFTVYMPVRLSIRSPVRPHSMPLGGPAIATLRALLLWARRAWPGNGLWGGKNHDATDHVAWGPQRSRKLRPSHYPFFLCVMSASLAVRPSVGPSARPHSMPSCVPHWRQYGPLVVGPVRLAYFSRPPIARVRALCFRPATLGQAIAA